MCNVVVTKNEKATTSLKNLWGLWSHISFLTVVLKVGETLKNEQNYKVWYAIVTFYFSKKLSYSRLCSLIYHIILETILLDLFFKSRILMDFLRALFKSPSHSGINLSEFPQILPEYPMGILSLPSKFQLSRCSELGVMAILILK